MKAARKGGRVLAAAALTLALQVAAQTPEEQERRAQEVEAAQRLEQVRAEIRLLSETQRTLEGERSDLVRELRAVDQAVDREARALREIDAALVRQQAELEQLQVQKAELENRLGHQRELLAQLLRSAYALGRHEQLKLLLAQDRIDDLARVLAYHRYFQRDRVQRIRSLLRELHALATLKQSLDEQRVRLAATQSEQQQRIAQLQVQRDERQAFIAALERRFADAGARLLALGRDERALVTLLESLRDIFADIPKQLEEAQTFSQRRRHLSLPLSGRRLSGFGSRLSDGRASRGWLIAGNSGDDVLAIAPGRVAYADWLKGYGLLLILDHGEGYMSLYAYNDSLLKEVGDWVVQSEVIAGVGNSGGQAVPALYFELRHQGRPVDPQGWFASR